MGTRLHSHARLERVPPAMASLNLSGARGLVVFATYLFFRKPL
jgi:hypothetical protein